MLYLQPSKGTPHEYLALMLTVFSPHTPAQCEQFFGIVGTTAWGMVAFSCFILSVDPTQQSMRRRGAFLSFIIVDWLNLIATTLYALTEIDTTPHLLVRASSCHTERRILRVRKRKRQLWLC